MVSSCDVTLSSGDLVLALFNGTSTVTSDTSRVRFCEGDSDMLFGKMTVKKVPDKKKLNWRSDMSAYSAYVSGMVSGASPYYDYNPAMPVSESEQPEDDTAVRKEDTMASTTEPKDGKEEPESSESYALPREAASLTNVNVSEDPPLPENSWTAFAIPSKLKVVPVSMTKSEQKSPYP